MLFNSLEFLALFLPATLAISRGLRGNALLGCLAAASLLFYALAGEPWFLIPMAVTAVGDFWVGQLLATAKPRVRKVLLVGSVSANLTLLAGFKYSGLLAAIAGSVVARFGGAPSGWLSDAWRVALPAGISFYTFQSISYVVDVYRGNAEPERNFLKYLSFIAFFPHLVAGPLTRHHQLLPQLGALAERGMRPRWSSGVLLFALGLVKKVLLADRMAALIDPTIDSVAAATAPAAWLALFGYALQIYFDFSGYSDMAIGLGRLFGVELPQNFDSPYQAHDPSDFWRRWHITLSRWLRDYLFIPLGGSRGSPARTSFNLIATMVLGGLWHGANATFAAWGLYHGVLLVVHRAAAPGFGRAPLRVRQLVTFLAICLGWVLFRANDLDHAFAWYLSLFGANGLGAMSPVLLALVAVGGWLAVACDNGYLRPVEQRPVWLKAGLGFAFGCALVAMNLSSRFLYFQF